MSLKKLVRRLYVEQSGRCFYCGRETWLTGVDTKDQAAWRFGIVRGAPGSRVALDARRATAEHLHRLADGGPKRSGNIVMACKRCNTHRGETPILEHQERMRVAEQRAEA